MSLFTKSQLKQIPKEAVFSLSKRKAIEGGKLIGSDMLEVCKSVWEKGLKVALKSTFLHGNPIGPVTKYAIQKDYALVMGIGSTLRIDFQTPMTSDLAVDPSNVFHLSSRKVSHSLRKGDYVVLREDLTNSDFKTLMNKKYSGGMRTIGWVSSMPDYRGRIGMITAVHWVAPEDNTMSVTVEFFDAGSYYNWNSQMLFPLEPMEVQELLDATAKKATTPVGILNPYDIVDELLDDDDVPL